MQETRVQSLGQEHPQEKEMAAHSLHWSLLENPMDRGAWWATVCGAEQLSTYAQCVPRKTGRDESSSLVPANPPNGAVRAAPGSVPHGEDPAGGPLGRTAERKEEERSGESEAGLGEKGWKSQSTSHRVFPFNLLKNIYLFIQLYRASVAARGIFHCSSWTL